MALDRKLIAKDQSLLNPRRDDRRRNILTEFLLKGDKNKLLFYSQVFGIILIVAQNSDWTQGFVFLEQSV